MPIVVFPSKRRRLDGWPPDFARSEPIDLPGIGYGSIRKEDRDVIKQLTGCSAAIRRRPSWNARKLTLSGPRDKMREAETMALGFIVRSQTQSPGQFAAPSGLPMHMPGMPMPNMFQNACAYPWPMHYPGWPIPQMPLPPYPNMMPFVENEDSQDSVDSDDMWSEAWPEASEEPTAAKPPEAAKEPEAAGVHEAAEEPDAANEAEESEADDVQYVSGPTTPKLFFPKKVNVEKGIKFVVIYALGMENLPGVNFRQKNWERLTTQSPKCSHDSTTSCTLQISSSTRGCSTRIGAQDGIVASTHTSFDPSLIPAVLIRGLQSSKDTSRRRTHRTGHPNVRTSSQPAARQASTGPLPQLPSCSAS